MTVDAVRVGIVALPQFEVGHIFQTQFLARAVGAQNEVFKLANILLAACIAQGILEGAGGILADRADARLHVLLLQECGDVAGHNAVAGHCLGAQPDAQCILSAPHLTLAHALDAQDGGAQVVIEIV